MSTAHFITISHIFQPEIKMYHAYAIDTQTNTFYVGVIAAERTYTLHRWMTTEFQQDNDLIIAGVPVLAISAAAAQTRDHMDGSWRLGSLHATARVTEGWSWNSFTSSLMPPVSNAITRTFTLGIGTQPMFICRGFGHDAVPLLEAVQPAVVGPYRMLQAQLVCLAKPNIDAQPGNIRKHPPPSKRDRSRSPQPSSGSRRGRRA